MGEVIVIKCRTIESVVAMHRKAGLESTHIKEDPGHVSEL